MTDERDAGRDRSGPAGHDGQRRHILVFAYACEPDRGSEPGAGWGLVQTISQFADCTVLVGSEHVGGIRRWERANPRSDMRFVEVPEPWVMKPRDRHRLTRFLLYLLWLARAHRVGHTLHRQHRFAVVWHVTYSTYWLPTPAVCFGVPCIWGPVGGAVVTPHALRPLLGWRGLISEWFDYAAVRAFSLWPRTRRTWQLARTRIVQNPETLARLPGPLRADAVLLNHAVFTIAPAMQHRTGGGSCLFVGPLESRKGASLAIRALQCAAGDVTLVIVGDGPERRRLETLARRLGVASRVTFTGWIDRDRVMAYVAAAAAVVFPGLREEGGLALAEAMLAGAPVIVLANGGAKVIAELSTDPTRVAMIEPADIATTARSMGGAMTRFTRTAPAGSEPMLSTAASSAALYELFHRSCTVPCE